MRVLYILHISSLTFSFIQAQNFEKVNFSDDSSQNYYIALKPNTEEIAGAIILLPGFGETAESIFSESKIQNVAYSNGLLTIAIAGGQKLYADNGVIEKLDKALEHVKSKYKIDRSQFIIGGFSAGGTLSLRYAEHCSELGDKAVIQPKGVFTVDSPIDLFNIWDYFQREMEKGFSQVGIAEATFVSNLMKDEIGTPSESPETYDKLTPFNLNLKTPGNEKFLKNIAVRVYHDIDVAWQLKNRRRSLFDSNALAASELINRLLLLGNESAEFMLSEQPGYRSSGQRHTHSWSIVNEIELIQWAKQLLNN